MPPGLVSLLSGRHPGIRPWWFACKWLPHGGSPCEALTPQPPKQTPSKIISSVPGCWKKYFTYSDTMLYICSCVCLCVCVCVNLRRKHDFGEVLINNQILHFVFQSVILFFHHLFYKYLLSSYYTPGSFFCFLCFGGLLFSFVSLQGISVTKEIGETMTWLQNPGVRITFNFSFLLSPDIASNASSLIQNLL